VSPLRTSIKTSLYPPFIAILRGGKRGVGRFSFLRKKSPVKKASVDVVTLLSFTLTNPYFALWETLEIKWSQAGIPSALYRAYIENRG